MADSDNNSFLSSIATGYSELAQHQAAYMPRAGTYFNPGAMNGQTPTLNLLGAVGQQIFGEVGGMIPMAMQMSGLANNLPPLITTGYGGNSKEAQQIYAVNRSLMMMGITDFGGAINSKFGLGLGDQGQMMTGMIAQMAAQSFGMSDQLAAMFPDAASYMNLAALPFRMGATDAASAIPIAQRLLGQFNSMYNSKMFGNVPKMLALTAFQASMENFNDESVAANLSIAAHDMTVAGMGMFGENINALKMLSRDQLGDINSLEQVAGQVYGYSKVGLMDARELAQAGRILNEQSGGEINSIAGALAAGLGSLARNIGPNEAAQEKLLANAGQGSTRILYNDDTKVLGAMAQSNNALKKRIESAIKNGNSAELEKLIKIGRNDPKYRSARNNEGTVRDITNMLGSTPNGVEALGRAELGLAIDSRFGNDAAAMRELALNDGKFHGRTLEDLENGNFGGLSTKTRDLYGLNGKLIGVTAALDVSKHKHKEISDYSANLIKDAHSTKFDPIDQLKGAINEIMQKMNQLLGTHMPLVGTANDSVKGHS